MKRSTIALATMTAAIALAGAAEARDQIRIVGSSTVFPFSTAVAEQFGQTSGFATPVVESTGSGGGLKLFCAGVGEEHPDMTNASRPIKDSEIETCATNGVKDVTEVKVGFDGIVLANSKTAEPVSLTIPQIWMALAKEVPVDGEIVANPYTMWNEIDSGLPAAKIEVLGPPPTSGTRDAFVELVMETGCEEFPEVAALEETDEDKFGAVCATMREDGGFVEAGENDNLIVQKLEANPAALGIFGFSFLDQNLDKMQGNFVDGIEPTFENIAAGDYPVSRSLFFYVKNAHVGVIPGIQEFVEEFTSEGAYGEDGYLTDKGLIPLPEEDRNAVRESATSLTPMS
ncbi:MAG: substrate-binding domain-containing protein [Geminicoccaceae bacterium]